MGHDNQPFIISVTALLFRISKIQFIHRKEQLKWIYFSYYVVHKGGYTWTFLWLVSLTTHNLPTENSKKGGRYGTWVWLTLLSLIPGGPPLPYYISSTTSSQSRWMVLTSNINICISIGSYVKRMFYSNVTTHCLKIT